MNTVYQLALLAALTQTIACSSSDDEGGESAGAAGTAGTAGTASGTSGAGAFASTPDSVSGSGGAGAASFGGQGGSVGEAGATADVAGGGAGGSGVARGGTAGLAGGTGGTGGTSNAGAGGKAGSSSQGGSAGATSTGGTPGRATACNFASGINNPWVHFGGDVPNPDLNTFKAVYKNTRDAGGRIVRWWFHTNGTVTPGYDSSGLPKGLAQSHVDGVKAILGAAHDAGLSVVVSLWSFDMLQDNAGPAHTNNQKLLEMDANRSAYIANYLTPLVKALKGTPGLYAYETFNEPEGMLPSGWATYRTQLKYVQACVNQFAAAIHDADPTVLVTNGTQVFSANSVGNGRSNNYSDSALRAAGGKQNGTLDFYQVHYYAVNGQGNSPFLRTASYWGLDKKLVMGEFYAIDTDGVAKKDLYNYLYDKGYNGAWGWAYDPNWNDIQVPMRAFMQAHPNVSCP